MNILLGSYPAKLAINHRVAIPAPLRKALGENIVIAKWYEECLVVVPDSTLSALLTRVTGKGGLITAPVRGSEHFIFSSAFEVIPDDQGRIVIPESLISYASLSEDIYFLGVGDRVEIWDKNIWEEKEKQIIIEAPKYVEDLAKENEK